MHRLILPLILVGVPVGVHAADQDERPTLGILEARGVLEASHSAVIAAPMARRLTHAGYRAGARFEANAVIARFDCAGLEAERDARADARRTLELRHRNQSELLVMGAAGELDVELAASELAQAASELRALDVRLEDCALRAPWAGTVVERHAQAHETPGAGAPIYTLVRAGASEVVLLVPSHWSRWLERGAAFDFEIDETGETVSAEVSRIGATVDPASQTLKVAGRITGRAGARPGMSGTARFAAPETPASGTSVSETGS